ncbi:non-specific lipid transfer protein GPI-anchored 11-like [Macadamia integrifolia]|uniref:non-specific lipid transfer protein GPI-anchored 11-like n=1 Tax=Macadamia integrifolia TaxID=60698 RepID=UPI001C4EB873|nr:non-specific lipid transfer protein GPI-anchored 11-like [Macadamia integrifolia]
MAKVWLVSVVFVICAVAAVESANAPAPAPAAAADCMSLVMNMADCLSYLSKGSKDKKPPATCCSGFKMVFNTKPECLCEGFKNSAQYGIDLDLDKAAKLPAACGVHNASASQCGSAPGAAPAQSPSATTPSGTPSATAPSPVTSGGITAETPAPAPKASSASSVSIPFVVLFSAVVASCFFF